MKNIIVLCIISPIIYRGVWHLIQVCKSRNALCGGCTKCDHKVKSSNCK